MIPADVALLVLAGVAGGVLSTVVSLASLVTYPALLGAGLSPLAANATNTVALVSNAVGAAVGSRGELRGQWGTVLRMAILAGAGGAAGAALLLALPPAAFELVAPVLIGGSALLLLVQPQLVARLGTSPRPGSPLLLLVAFAVSVYVGYFGAAGGVLMLAVLGMMFDRPLVQVNALKNMLTGTANTVAAVGFVLFGPVHWASLVPLACGFLVGGWTGPAIARRLPGQGLRYVAGGSGLALAFALAATTYS